MGLTESKHAEHLDFEKAHFDDLPEQATHKKISIKYPGTTIAHAVLDAARYVVDDSDDLDGEAFCASIVAEVNDEEYTLKDAILTSSLKGIPRLSENRANLVLPWRVLTVDKENVIKALHHGIPVLFSHKNGEQEGIITAFSEHKQKFRYIAYPDCKIRHIKLSSKTETFVIDQTPSANTTAITEYAFHSDTDTD